MLKKSMITDFVPISKWTVNSISYIDLTLYSRDKIISVIKLAYTSRCKQNLPIYGIKNKDLREFTTTEKDRDKGISRIPLALARLREEDILEEEA